MMGKAGEAFCSGRGLYQIAGVRKPFGAPGHQKCCVSCGAIDEDRCMRAVDQGPPCLAPGRSQLAVEITAGEHAEAEILEGPFSGHEPKGRSQTLLRPSDAFWASRDGRAGLDCLAPAFTS